MLAYDGWMEDGGRGGGVGGEAMRTTWSGGRSIAVIAVFEDGYLEWRATIHSDPHIWRRARRRESRHEQNSK